MVDDAQLIARSAEQPEYFAELFDRHYGRIAGYLRRRLAPAVAEDLAAQTFLIAFETRGRYDAARRDAAPWLYGIASNLARRHHRSEARRWKAYAAEAARDVPPTPPDIDRHLDAKAAAPAIAGAVATLKHGDRDALLLFAWGELSYEEISVALAIPIGTVRSRINRARRKLAERLDLPGESPTPSAAEPNVRPRVKEST